MPKLSHAMYSTGLAVLACLMWVSTASAGTLLTERVGVNYNNVYGDSATKTDFIRLRRETSFASLTAATNALNAEMTAPFKNFRVGFSRPMANDSVDLAQWIDEVEELTQLNNSSVLICFWGANDISDPTGDAAIWQTVIDALEARGLLSSVSGWELQNEPAGSSSAWRTYVRKLWKTLGGYGSTGWNSLTTAQRAQIAAAWKDKPIVIDGTNFAQHFDSTLVNGLSGLNNIVWALHSYPKFWGTTGRENWTVEQWQSQMVSTWNNNLSLLNGNVVITEMGMNKYDCDLAQNGGLGPAGTSVELRRACGLARAANQLFGASSNTTNFWYTAFNTSAIGLGKVNGTQEFRTDTVNGADHALNGTLCGSAPPPPAWTEIMFDDFESGWGNYLDLGGDCSLHTSGTYAPQGNSAANIQDNSGSASAFKTDPGMDLTGYTQLRVTFSYQAVSMESGEDFVLEYADGGSGGWQVIGTWVSGTDFNNNSIETDGVIIDSSQYNFTSDGKIRFRCDASGNSDDVYIDEILVEAQ